MLEILAADGEVTLAISVVAGWVIAAFTALGSVIVWLAVKLDKKNEKFEAAQRETVETASASTAAIESMGDRFGRLETTVKETLARLEAKP